MKMANFVTVLSILFVSLIYVTVECLDNFDNFIEDYCWRDYDGVAPLDAFKAGKARDGSPIYIGQTLFDDKLIPGKIHENASEIHIEFHVVHTLNETIKILCTEYPERFEWFKTRYDRVLQLTDKYLFQGGYERNYMTYIGRAFSHGETTVGKVVCYNRGYNNKACYKLTTIENGKWYDHGEFEILTYNPKATASSSGSSSTLPPATAKTGRNSEGPTKPGFLSYFFLVLVVAGLIVLIIVLVRRC